MKIKMQKWRILIKMFDCRETGGVFPWAFEAGRLGSAQNGFTKYRENPLTKPFNAPDQYSEEKYFSKINLAQLCSEQIISAKIKRKGPTSDFQDRSILAYVRLQTSKFTN